MQSLRPPTMLAILLLSLLLAACGGSPIPTAEATEAATPEATSESTPEASVEATADATDTALVSAVCTKLDLNNLTEDQLLSTIPDFSSRMVREFFEYRPYVSIQQFRREIGKYVDEAQVAAYEQYVYVPVDPNEVDADTLMQIDGVDETLANTLIEGRPYASNQAFLDTLAESLTADQVAQAACYLTSEA